MKITGLQKFPSQAEDAWLLWPQCSSAVALSTERKEQKELQLNYVVLLPSLYPAFLIK